MCPENCPDWQTIPCKHLQAELPDLRDSTSVAAEPVPDVDRFPITPEATVQYYEQERSMRLKLAKFVRSGQLRSIHIEVLVARFVYSYKLMRIKEELHLPSAETARSLLKTALRVLKEEGYSK